MEKKELSGLVSKEEFFKVKDDTVWTIEQVAEGGLLVSDLGHAGKVWCQVASNSEFYKLLFDYNAYKGVVHDETEEEYKIRTGVSDHKEVIK